jgi:hypothetical protein
MGSNSGDAAALKWESPTKLFAKTNRYSRIIKSKSRLNNKDLGQKFLRKMYHFLKFYTHAKKAKDKSSILCYQSDPCELRYSLNKGITKNTKRRCRCQLTS